MILEKGMEAFGISVAYGKVHEMFLVLPRSIPVKEENDKTFRHKATGIDAVNIDFSDLAYIVN